MTDKDKLEMLKSLVNGSYTDSFLSACLTIAGKKVLNRAYPYNPSITEVPEKYEMNQIQIAVYLVTKKGAWGQTAHAENGITRHYEDGDVPASLLREIVPTVGVI